MKKVFSLQLITFLSAFLLFQIELILAKTLLPGYGGSYMVWGACMVFFQATLLAGYYFSHMVLRHIGISKYLSLHLVLLLLPLLLFPGRALSLSPQNNTEFLAIDVFRQLLLTIGPVFFLLSTMSIVTQVWLAGSSLTQRDNPYTLYAWSNLGSFAALLTYPFVFEYFFDLSMQLLIWRIAYVLLIALNIAGWFLIPQRKEEHADQRESVKPGKTKFIRCFLLSTGGVMLFLAVTNIITVEIAPIPLIWIIPLSIYLLTFVLTFKNVPWYPKVIDRYIHSITGFSIILFFLLQQQALPVIIGATIIIILLFLTCMYCQNQLLGLRPADHRRLTAFYLVISLGGFAGGLLTSWIIPLISNLLLEYLLALLIIALTFPFPAIKAKKNNMIFQVFIVSAFILVVLMWPSIIPANNFMGVLSGTLVALGLLFYFKNIKYAMAISLIAVILFSPYLEMAWTKRNFVYQKRNFYGIYQVYNTGRIRRFRHGATLHGSQIMDPENPQNQLVPTTYYGLSSPVASILGSPDSFPLHRIGVVGLGAGTLAIYTRPGQIMDFYELDPEVYKIASQYFTFLDRAQGKINLFIGDGRLNLKNQREKYDLLIIDAFNGDIVPYHLITKEMVEICRQHLNPNGILLFHLSNRYFSLERILSRIGAELNTENYYKLGTNSGDNVEELSFWGAFTWDKNVSAKLLSQGWSSEKPSEYSNLRVWTDQYSNVLPVIK
jgi:hypothetical protein